MAPNCNSTNTHLLENVMPRKITVKFNGKVIGTRTTDRLYTHALVLADFDPAIARALNAADWLTWGKTDARSAHAHSIEAAKPTYRYARAFTNEERDRHAVVAALPLEQYVAQKHAVRLQRLEDHIARCISQGATVLSYHGSRDLAFKAKDAASKAHPTYLVLLEPVERP